MSRIFDAIAGTSRVKIEDFVAKFDSFSTRDLSNWAARQPRPFQLSKELMKALDQRENDYTTLDRLRGTGFLSLAVFRERCIAVSTIILK